MSWKTDARPVVNKFEIGRTFIDETGFEEIDNETVRERKQMAYDGVITPIVMINAQTGALEGKPEIVARGVIGSHNGLMVQLQRLVAKAVESATVEDRRDPTLLKEKMRLELKRYVQKQTRRAPSDCAGDRGSLSKLQLCLRMNSIVVENLIDRDQSLAERLRRARVEVAPETFFLLGIAHQDWIRLTDNAELSQAAILHS
ncbi:MAG: hypothetical protein WKF84_05315 [Pyrinomonadaceae bacterium]